MKLRNFFFLGAIALGMIACDKTDVDTPIKDGEKATISLAITQNNISTRAIGTAELPAEEGYIKKLEVFVFNGDTRDGYKMVEPVSPALSINEVTDIAVTTGSRNIIVVANATTDLSTITSKTQLLAQVASLDAQEPSNIAANGLVMTSADSITYTIVANDNTFPNPIPVQRVAARVALVSATVVFPVGSAYAGWEFEPEQVFMYNAKNVSNIFGKSLINETEYWSGHSLITPFDGTLKPNLWVEAWTKSFLTDSVADLSTIANDKPVYFYAFENNNADYPTVITIKGKLKDADSTYIVNQPFTDDAGFTYYSIIVNGNLNNYEYSEDYDNNDSTIKQNTQYNISVTITGTGTNDPTDPPKEKSQLDVNVVVTDWVVVGQVVEY